MRDAVNHGRGSALLVATALLAILLAGCGGSDDGGGPEPTPDCAISGVTTGLATSWLTGEDVDIRWTHNEVPGTVKIELTKAGSVVQTIAASTANDGFHAWTASTGGQANGADFGIRVTGTGDAGCTDEVTGLTIIDVAGCDITFTAAVDTINAGESFEITWDSASTSGAVDIELYKSLPNSLGDFVGTIVTEAPDDGSFTWTVDSFHVGTLFYRYRIVDPLVGGCEAISLPFRMIDDDLCVIDVFGPSTGGSYAQGDTLEIDVDQTLSNGSGIVNLRLYAGDEFVSGGFIKDGLIVPDGLFDWVVDNYNYTGAQSNFKIKAFDVNDSYCIGESGRFTITGN